MATKVASLYAEIGADTSKIKQGLTESRAGLQGLKGEADKVKSGMSSAFVGVADVVGKAGAAVAVFGATFSAVMEFGKAGAQLEVTRTKFDRLSSSIGTTGEQLLGKLKPAIGGLMSDAKIVDGATQIMSLGLAKDEESVVRLATLVTKLGWDMQQVILTFANNSKMRLDALGLSVEDVTKRAAALEKQGYDTDKAFDMAVIEAGEAKLLLLGDQAQTTVGKFARMESAIENVSDRLKEKLAPGIASAAEAVSTLLTWNERITEAQDQHAKEVEKTAKSYEEYRTEALRVIAATTGVKLSTDGAIIGYNSLGAVTKATAQISSVLTEEQWKLNAAIREAIKNTGTSADYVDRLSGSTVKLTEATEKQAKATQEQRADQISIGKSLADEADALDELRDKSSDTGKEIAKLAAENKKMMGMQGKVKPLSMEGLEDAYKHLSRAMEDVAHGNRAARIEVEKWDAIIGGKGPKQFYDYAKAIGENSEKLAELGKAERERYTAFLEMSQQAVLATMEERFAREGWSAAETEAYTNAAVSMGIMTQAQADQAANLATLNAAFDTGKLTAKEYADALMINGQEARTAATKTEDYGASMRAAMEEPVEATGVLKQTLQDVSDVAEFQVHRVFGGEAGVISDLENIKAISNSSKESIGEPLNEAMYMVRDAAAEAGGAIGGAVGGLDDLKSRDGQETHFWVITHTKEIVEPGEVAGGAPAGSGAGGGGAGGGGGHSQYQFGGPVFPGKTYLVGEREPELFSPKASGFILPNAAGVYIAPGAIVINATQGMSEQALADKVVGALSVKLGQRVRSQRAAGAGVLGQ